MVQLLKLCYIRIISINNSGMNATLCLIVKLLAVAAIASSAFSNFGNVYLSFFEILDTSLKSYPVQFIWRLLFYSSALLLIFNFKVKANSIILSLLIFAGLIFSQNVFSNNSFFCGCIFFLSGVSKKSYNTNLIIIQLAIMYLGALLDKIAFPDWRDGSFYTAFHGKRLYFKYLTLFFPSVNFALLFSWMSIFIEFMLFCCLLFPKSRKLAFYLGLFFHISTAMLGQTLYIMFIPALLISYIAILPVHDSLKLGYSKKYFSLLMPEAFINNISFQDELYFEIGKKKYFGLNAQLRLFFLSPVFLYCLTIIITFYTLPIKLRLLILLLSAITIPVLLIVTKNNTLLKNKAKTTF